MPTVTLNVSAADATILQAAYPNATAQEIVTTLVSREVAAVDKRVKENARNTILLSIVNLTTEQLTRVADKIQQFVTGP